METQVLQYQRQQMNEFVREQIMDWLMDGRIAPGEKINIEKIAQMLGVSRMPVREALRSMEEAGLAKYIPYVGYTLVDVDAKRVNELYLIRQKLEPMAASIACDMMTDEAIINCEKIQEDFEKSMSSPGISAKEVYKINKKFHFAIYECCEMEVLCNTIDNLWNHLSFYKLLYGRGYIHDKKRSQKMIKEHREYIQCLKDRNSKKLNKLMHDNFNHLIGEIPSSIRDMKMDKAQ